MANKAGARNTLDIDSRGRDDGAKRPRIFLGHSARDKWQVRFIQLGIAALNVISRFEIRTAMYVACVLSQNGVT